MDSVIDHIQNNLINSEHIYILYDIFLLNENLYVLIIKIYRRIDRSLWPFDDP